MHFVVPVEGQQVVDLPFVGMGLIFIDRRQVGHHEVFLKFADFSELAGSLGCGVIRHLELVVEPFPVGREREVHVGTVAVYAAVIALKLGNRMVFAPVKARIVERLHHGVLVKGSFQHRTLSFRNQFAVFVGIREVGDKVEPRSEFLLQVHAHVETLVV